MVLKTAFLGTKGQFKQMILVHGESYELLMKNEAVIPKGDNSPLGMK